MGSCREGGIHAQSCKQLHVGWGAGVRAWPEKAGPSTRPPENPPGHPGGDFDTGFWNKRKQDFGISVIQGSGEASFVWGSRIFFPPITTPEGTGLHSDHLTVPVN